MKKLACIVCVLLQASLPAQPLHKLDSLLRLVKDHTPDTSLANIYNDLAYLYTRINADSSDLFTKKAMELSGRLKYRKGLCEAYNNTGINFYIRGAYADAEKPLLLSKKIAEELNDRKAVVNRQNNLGIIYYSQGRFSEALANYNRSLSASRADKDTMAMVRALDLMASVYIQQSDYDKALGSYLQALAYYEKKNHKNGLTQVYNNIGNVYDYLDNHDKSIEYYEACVRLCKKSGDKYGLAPVYNNLGNMYRKKGDLENAGLYFGKSLKLSREMKNAPGIAYNLTALGSLALAKNDLSTALKHYNEALAIHEANRESQSVAGTLNQLGLVKIQLGQYAEAEAALTRAMHIARSLRIKNTLAECYTSLALLYKKQKNFGRSLVFLELYAAMRDTLLSDDKNKSMAEMQTRFDTDKKEKEIALLTKTRNIEELKLAEQAANLKSQRAAIYASLSGITLALTLAFFVIRGYAEKKKANLLLQEKNAAISGQKQILEEKNLLITDSIEYARNIQEAILPDPSVFKSSFKDAFVLFRPKDVVSGDFYWMRKNASGEKLLAAIDCVGHGVPGAFMALHSYNLLERLSAEHRSESPARLLDELNKLVIESLNQQTDGSAVKHGMDLALLKIKGNVVEYAGARHPLIIVGTEYREIRADAMYIGGAQGNFTHHSIEVEPGAMLYLFTDGYPDQKGGPQNKKFFVSEFKKLLQSLAGKSCAEQQQALEETFSRWKGNSEQIDDVLVMGVRV